MSINVSFVSDPAFVSAYYAGLSTLDCLPEERRRLFQYDPWRVYIALQVAKQCLLVQGDFVECGVNTGFLAKSILHQYYANLRARRFYLCDTWAGVQIDQLSDNEIKDGKASVNQGYYDIDIFQPVSEIFRIYDNVKLVRGTVPESLSQVGSGSIAYLSIDMNCAYPEVKAIEYFWPLISRGGCILLDDYGFAGYAEQKSAIDKLMHDIAWNVIQLPSGQGLIIKG
jgi:O-methyltransferase